MIILPVQIKGNQKVALIDQSKFVFGDIKFFGLVYKGYFYDMKKKNIKIMNIERYLEQKKIPLMKW